MQFPTDLERDPAFQLALKLKHENGTEHPWLAHIATIVKTLKLGCSYKRLNYF